jgi:hypothetical protein
MPHPPQARNQPKCEGRWALRVGACPTQQELYVWDAQQVQSKLLIADVSRATGQGLGQAGPGIALLCQGGLEEVDRRTGGQACKASSTRIPSGDRRDVYAYGNTIWRQTLEVWAPIPVGVAASRPQGSSGGGGCWWIVSPFWSMPYMGPRRSDKACARYATTSRLRNIKPPASINSPKPNKLTVDGSGVAVTSPA